MTRDETLHILADHAACLKRDFSVRALSVFGSVGRDEATGASDVDVLVEFDPDAAVGLFTFLGLQTCLETLLNRPVDLATPAGLHPMIRDRVLREAVRAA